MCNCLQHSDRVEIAQPNASTNRVQTMKGQFMGRDPAEVPPPFAPVEEPPVSMPPALLPPELTTRQFLRGEPTEAPTGDAFGVLSHHGVQLYNPVTRTHSWTYPNDSWTCFGSSGGWSGSGTFIGSGGYVTRYCHSNFPYGGIDNADIDYTPGSNSATNEWAYFRAYSPYGYPIRAWVESIYNACSSSALGGLAVQLVSEVQISGQWYYAGRHVLAHLDDVQVSIGQYISNFAYIGRVIPYNPSAPASCTTGQHLHLEIWGNWLTTGRQWSVNQIVAQLWA